MHSDLANKIYRDGSGIIGYNAITNAAPDMTRSDANDDNGHGSECAGIAAAQSNDGIGIAGIAGWNAIAGQSDANNVKLMPVKVSDSLNRGNSTYYGDGVKWAADHGANIISMSFALDSHAQISYLSDKLQYAYNKGCLLVAAAGNDGGQSYNYPAHDANVISVAASDSSDTLAGFSTYGSWVSVSAPGGKGDSVTAPVASEEVLSDYAANGSFTDTFHYDYGTSMACPHVAGEAALIWSQNPSLTNDQVRSIILNNTDPVGTYYQNIRGTYYPHTIGNGRVNVYRALVAATSHGSDVKLLPVGNYLYGTTLAGGTNSRGTIFLVDPTNGDNHAAGLVIHNFADGLDGAHPFGGLTQSPDGYLYGTCSQGGQYGLGTVWRIKPDGSGYSVVFHIGTGGGASNGANPRCALALTSDNSTLAGVMPNGGSNGVGTVFAVNPAGGFLNLTNFSGYPYDGASPTDGITIGSDGNFWGVTQTGGSYGLGTLFHTSANGHANAYSFGQNSSGSLLYGAFPSGLPLECGGGLAGTFVMTTQAGGQYGQGLVASVNGQGTLASLFSFNGSTGSAPRSGLIFGSDQSFYGTTFGGGQYGLGTVYRQDYTTNAGGHSILQNIGDASGGSDANGSGPVSGLTLGLGSYASTYFGATSQGGDFGNGCVYALTASGGRRVIFMFPANY